MKQTVTVLLILTLLLSACGGSKYLPEGTPVPSASPEPASISVPAPAPTEVHVTTAAPEGLRYASDYAELFASLTAAGRGYGGWAVDSAEAPTAVAESASVAVNGADKSAGGDYSGTNVQVAGIDEGDIVKTDGEYIYVLNGSYTLTVIKADGENSAVVSRTSVGTESYAEWDESGSFRHSSMSKYPREMFLCDGVLAVLSYYNSYRYSKSFADDGWESESESYTCVDLYDVSDPSAPRLTAALGQDGTLLGSRLLDGRLYLVTQYWVWAMDEDDPVTYVPRVYNAGTAELLPADCIAICGENTEYVVVCAYDLASGTLTARQSLLGAGSTLYMNGANLYVLGSRWTQTEERTYTESVYTVTEYRSGSDTEIYRFDLAGGLTLAAGGAVPGALDSQFSADEWGGHLRLVTTRNESRYRIYEDETYGFSNYQWDGNESGNDLYILDMNLNVVGSVTDLAPDEYVYSARFDGEIAYFTTFRTVDPLFTVDCSDPANPVVRSALKISGFSEYLHPWGEGRLFGFGREADETTGRAGGLKLVMFDTTDKTDVTAESTYALDANYSEALYNHKAFFIVPEKNVIGFVGEGDYYIFSYDAETGFTLLCRFDFERWEYNARGLYIGDRAYIVGQEELVVLDMNTWGEPTVISIGAD